MIGSSRKIDMADTRRREHGTMDFHPKTPEERINALRHIVENKEYAKIDGIMVDLFSASCIMSVYNALNKTNKERFAEQDVRRMTYIAFELMD